jgi:hypothetical protein
MPRLVLIALLCASVPAAPAAASLLGSSDGAAQSGHAVVAECDDAEIADYQTAGGFVTAVVVKGIADPACSGGRLRVALTASSVGVATGGPVTVPTDADSLDDTVTVPVSAGAAASQVDRVDVLIEDPS